MYLRWPSANMVSNASDDLPEPDIPVMMTNWSRGISISSDLRLCSFAPRIRMHLVGSTSGFFDDDFSVSDFATGDFTFFDTVAFEGAVGFEFEGGFRVVFGLVACGLKAMFPC